jgi:hypothetical protein
LLLLLGACARSPAEPPAGERVLDAGVPVFSREAFSSSAADAGVDPPVATTVEPAALDEILAAAGRARPPSGVDRGGLLGTETKVPLEAGAAVQAPAPLPRSGTIRVGKVVVEPGMSTPSIERAARAQIYWPLVQRCRDPEGAILPPEVVHLAFQIDLDGYIVPSTVLAVPKEPRFGEAARCMARELGMTSFRAPAAARGLVQHVTTDVPSVD